MYSHMRIDNTGEEEYLYRGRLHNIRYCTGDWFNIPLQSRVNSLAISVSCVKIGTSVCSRPYQSVLGYQCYNNTSALYSYVLCDYLEPASATTPTASPFRIRHLRLH